MKRRICTCIVSTLLILGSCTLIGCSSKTTPATEPEETAAPSEEPTADAASDTEDQTDTAESTSADEKTPSYYYGKWQITSIYFIEENKTMTAEEIEKEGDTSLSKTYLILSETGDSYFTSTNTSGLSRWSVISTGVKVGDVEMTLENDKLAQPVKAKNEKDLLYYWEKVSDDQTFPETEETQTDDASSADAQADAASEDTQADASASGEIRPEIKEALDSYEQFFANYADFMTKFANAEDTTALLSEYMDYMSQYTDMLNKFNAMKDMEMNDAELAYYTEVSLRINQSLLEAVQ